MMKKIKQNSYTVQNVIVCLLKGASPYSQTLPYGIPALPH
jgi:hypothetical protein